MRENAESKRVEIESKIHAQTTQSVENQPQQPQSFTQENAQQKHIDNIDKLIDKVDKAKQQLEQEQEKPQQEPTFRKRTMRKSNTSFDLEM